MDIKVNKNKRIQCGVRLDKEQYIAVREISRKEKVTISEVIRAIVYAWYINK